MLRLTLMTSTARPRLQAAMLAVVMVGVLVPLHAGQPPSTATPSAFNAMSSAIAGNTAILISGQVLAANRVPVPAVPVRLRNVDRSLVVGETSTNQTGEFSFLISEGGSYIAELTDGRGRVRAVGELMILRQGETFGTLLRLPATRPTFAGLFGNSAAAIMSAAAGAGVTAFAATGNPLSPER